MLLKVSAIVTAATGKQESPMPHRYSAVPQCSICVEDLGKYGGPATLSCGQYLCSTSHRYHELNKGRFTG